MSIDSKQTQLLAKKLENNFKNMKTQENQIYAYKSKKLA